MAKQRKEMDYAAQINKAIRQYEDCEDHRPTKQHSIQWICNWISWCWKYHKITLEQMHDFADRMVAVMEIYKGEYA